MRVLYDGCPLCEQKNSIKIAEPDCTGYGLYHPSLPKTLPWLKCQACNHVYTEGYWSEEALRLLFSKIHTNQRPGDGMEEGRFTSAEIIEKVSRYLPKNSDGRWLDVGFGNGSLMFTASEYGFDVTGLDLRCDSVTLMQNIGFKAHCCDIQDFKSRDPFEVISFADCLEHVPYPRKVLEAAGRLITRGGVLFLSMPNISAPLWGYLNQTGNAYWIEMEHHHNFSKERLYSLLRETGFEPITYGVSKRYRACMEVIARAL